MNTLIQFETMTETAIIGRILNGEKPLYEIIVRRFNPLLYKIGRSYNYNHEDTQDLMQDTFVDAFKNLAQFDSRSGFKTWIVRIMLNNCFRKKQKSSFKNEFANDVKDNAIPMFTNPQNDLLKMVQTRELGSIIEEALAKIPHDYRMVFSLREINGMNVAETASLMNISEANVKVRLNRSKAMLRGEIEKSYSASELFEFNAVYCDAMAEKVMSIINQL